MMILFDKRNGRMAEWQKGGMAERRNGGLAEWRNGGMVEKRTEWRNGGMAELRNGGMAEWRDGRNRYLPTSFMVHADDDTDTFKSFIVQADRAFGTDSCHDVFFFVSFVFILLI